MPTPDLESIVRALCASGESYYIEFKSAFTYGPDGRNPRDIKEIAHDIGQTVVAFANADGGDLLVGVEDSGQITGLPHKDDHLHYLGQAHIHQIREGTSGRPEVRVHQVTIDGHRVLLFRVSEHPGEVIVTSDGRCLVRQKAQSVPVTPREIESRRHDRTGDRQYEAEPVPNATLADLDVQLVQSSAPRHLQTAFTDVHDLLRYWNLVEQRNGSIILRRAALLLFAREPLRWHANNRIRIRRIHGDSSGFGRGLNTQERDFPEAIASQLLSVIPFLTRQLERDARGDMLFVTTTLLPREAVEECVVNAVAHRNYAIEGQAAEILLHPDRVEVRSPGRLPTSITVADLKEQRGVHRSRNPIIMRVLRDLGYTRDQGEGMRRIFGSMRQVELHEPELEEHADTFVVRLSTRSRYDDATQAWLSAYGPFGLTAEARKYVVALRDAGQRLSVDRLARQASESYDETKRSLIRLEDLGIVWHKPQSRTYRLVEPLNVPHERAYQKLSAVGVELNRDTRIDLSALARIAKTPDVSTQMELARLWVASGILRPDGPKRWALGESLLAYVQLRDASPR